MTALLGVFRFVQGLGGRFDTFWFYGGPGEVAYRLGLFITLGFTALYELRLVNKRLIQIIEESHREHYRAQRGILITVAGFSDNSQYEEPGHVERVGLLSESLALALGWDYLVASELREAAQLHDLGKIAVPDSVLEKSDSLTGEELALMRRHTHLGAEILSFSSLPIYQLAARIAAEHHENWDGTGYPAGLAGDKIAPESRIVAICDVIDALSRRRSYKDPWDSGQILDFLLAERGKKFDPHMVDAAVQIRLWEMRG
jgi:response regulator RpfG family c-di-GMP phosphodiesterase